MQSSFPEPRNAPIESSALAPRLLATLSSARATAKDMARPIVRRLRADKKKARRRWFEVRWHNRIDPTCRLAHDIEIIDSTLAEWSGVAHHGRVLRSSIGAYSSVGRCSTVVDADLGRFVATSWDLTINAGALPDDRWISTSFAREAEGGDRGLEPGGRRVRVGNDVWLGANCVIMEGCTIGDGAIVGARAVVTSDVPPYAIVVGNPAKVTRLRFPERQVDRLVRLGWWNLDRETLKANIGLFQREADARVIDAIEQLCLTRRSKPSEP